MRSLGRALNFERLLSCIVVILVRYSSRHCTRNYRDSYLFPNQAL